MDDTFHNCPNYIAATVIATSQNATASDCCCCCSESTDDDARSFTTDAILTTTTATCIIVSFQSDNDTTTTILTSFRPTANATIDRLSASAIRSRHEFILYQQRALLPPPLSQFIRQRMSQQQPSPSQKQQQQSPLVGDLLSLLFTAAPCLPQLFPHLQQDLLMQQQQQVFIQ